MCEELNKLLSHCILNLQNKTPKFHIVSMTHERYFSRYVAVYMRCLPAKFREGELNGLLALEIRPKTLSHIHPAIM